jgi:hypothetical protein
LSHKGTANTVVNIPISASLTTDRKLYRFEASRCCRMVDLTPTTTYEAAAFLLTEVETLANLL